MFAGGGSPVECLPRSGPPVEGRWRERSPVAAITIDGCVREQTPKGAPVAGVSGEMFVRRVLCTEGIGRVTKPARRLGMSRANVGAINPPQSQRLYLSSAFI